MGQQPRQRETCFLSETLNGQERAARFPNVFVVYSWVSRINQLVSWGRTIYPRDICGSPLCCTTALFLVNSPLRTPGGADYSTYVSILDTTAPVESGVFIYSPGIEDAAEEKWQRFLYLRGTYITCTVYAKYIPEYSPLNIYTSPYALPFFFMIFDKTQTPRYTTQHRQHGSRHNTVAENRWYPGATMSGFILASSAVGPCDEK